MCLLTGPVGCKPNRQGICRGNQADQRLPQFSGDRPGMVTLVPVIGCDDVIQNAPRPAAPMRFDPNKEGDLGCNRLSRPPERIGKILGGRFYT